MKREFIELNQRNLILAIDEVVAVEKCVNGRGELLNLIVITRHGTFPLDHISYDQLHAELVGPKEK